MERKKTGIKLMIIVFYCVIYSRSMKSATDTQGSQDRDHTNPDLDLEPVSQPEVTGQYESMQKITNSSQYYNIEPNPYQSLSPQSDYEIVD